MSDVVVNTFASKSSFMDLLLAKYRILRWIAARFFGMERVPCFQCYNFFDRSNELDGTGCVQDCGAFYCRLCYSLMLNSGRNICFNCRQPVSYDNIDVSRENPSVNIAFDYAGLARMLRKGVFQNRVFGDTKIRDGDQN